MTTETLNKKLADVFASGVGTAGLEVGTDVSLGRSAYTQIPHRMVKKWAARVSTDRKSLANYEAYVARRNGDEYVFVVSPEGPIPASDQPVPSYRGSPGDMSGCYGWVTSGCLYCYSGSLWLRRLDGSNDEAVDVAIDEFHVESPTADDVMAFYAVNVGHIEDESFSAGTRFWIHAARFWAVVSGFVASVKQMEFRVVKDPVSYPDDANEFAVYCVNFRDNAWTSCVARAASWRKTGHAAGGKVVAGFPRRWIEKLNFGPVTDNIASRRQEWQTVTRAFVLATHAASVHNVLALVAPNDINHWASINPSYGLVTHWDIHASVRCRLAPNSQVAGVAMVVDSMVVFKRLVQEGLAPLVASAGQARALREALTTVESFGLQCASHASWFLSGHPLRRQPRPFNQKDPTFAELVGELAVVAREFYPSTPIAKSHALANAAEQLCNPAALGTWRALAREKDRLSAEKAALVYRRMRMGRNDANPTAQFTAGVAIEYNRQLINIAAVVGVTPRAMVAARSGSSVILA